MAGEIRDLRPSEILVDDALMGQLLCHCSSRGIRGALAIERDPLTNEQTVHPRATASVA
jgi:hypothetical protein